MRYAVVIERAQGNYSAHVPDLPGCIATGDSIEEVEAEMRDAIEFHLEGLREDGNSHSSALKPCRVCRGHGVNRLGGRRVHIDARSARDAYRGVLPRFVPDVVKPGLGIGGVLDPQARPSLSCRMSRSLL